MSLRNSDETPRSSASGTVTKKTKKRHIKNPPSPLPKESGDPNTNTASTLPATPTASSRQHPLVTSKKRRKSARKNPDNQHRRSILSSSLITRAMVFLPLSVGVLASALYLQSARAQSQNGTSNSTSGNGNGNGNGSENAPRYAQVIRPSSFAVLDTVPSQVGYNASQIFFPPGTDADSLKAQPFLIFDNAFYDIIGSDPTLTLIADSGTDPLFHEATTWNPATDEMFFVQNAGAPAAGTGLNKSAIVQKISLAQAQQLVGGNGTGQVDVIDINSTQQVVNPNGATNFRGKIVFTAEGQGADVPSALYLVNPVEPYETSVILNNFYGRQFNSLNDVAVNPKNKQLYFTDVTYGYLQNFRPAPILPNQVYRFDVDSGALGVVADGFNLPNGITFSPDGQFAYISDTGINAGFWGFNYTKSAAIYRYDVKDDGTFNNRVTFAFVDSGVADGIHCDNKGNVYAGCGDGVHVWNPAGLLLGKIWLGETSANFQFAGRGRMVICAETKLYYATLAAEGADITSQQYSG